jgi:hypothetical protein
MESINQHVTPAFTHNYWHGKQPYKHHGRNLKSGNRCDHNPKVLAKWRLFIPKNLQRTSYAVADILKGIEHYYDSPFILPTLSNQTGKLNKDGKPRSNRSEARETEFLILTAIVYCIDFASMRVGTPKDDGGFIPRSWAFIAKLAGLAEWNAIDEKWIPISRFWDGVDRLVMAGAWESHIQYKIKKDGTRRARPSIKKFNPDFLIGLGSISYEKLKKIRDYSSQRITEKTAEYKHKYAKKIQIETDTQIARVRLEAKTGISKPKPRKRAKPQQEVNTRTIEAYNRAKLDLQSALVKKGEKLSVIRQLITDQFPSYEQWKLAPT